MAADASSVRGWDAASEGATRRRADAIVFTLKNFDDYVPDVDVVIDD
jgi:hypothetical protein